MQIGRYLRTIRYLKPRQVRARLRLAFPAPRPDEDPHPQLHDRTGTFREPILRRDGWIGPARVRFLNIERDLVRAAGVGGGPAADIDWHPRDASRLWIYNLHYFSDLPGTADGSVRPWLSGAVLSWIGANPPGTSDAWDPYPLSHRIVNWVKWMLLDGSARELSERDRGATVQSLAVQARALERRLEHHLLGNHLLANAKALVFAGCFFAGEEAVRWLKTGLDLLLSELAEQVLDDGGHFERSPMYHALVLEDVLDVVNLLDAFGCSGAGDRAHLTAIAERMLAWLAGMVHQDGGIAFFNDAALGVAPSLDELRAYAGRLGITAGGDVEEGAHHRKESGYIRIVPPDDATLVIFDVGTIGPDYQPGHSHCDTLSVEISRNGRRVFVNSGISTYEKGSARLEERRTASHNTIRIDGEEQSEVWASHRCGRRARPLAVTVGDRSGEGGHDGYRHLRGGPEHRRRVSVLDDSVVIDDTITGRGTHLVESFLHLHPDVEAALSEGAVRLSVAGRPFAKVRVGQDGESVAAPHSGREIDSVGGPAPGRRIELAVEASTWHPEFGLSVPNRRIVSTRRGPLPLHITTTIEWARS
jgi:hypothetical protein